MIDSPVTGNDKRAAMDWFDRKVLHYVLFWAPAGGMDDEDVFPEFGMRVDQLNERFDSIISTLSGRGNNIGDSIDALLFFQFNQKIGAGLAYDLTLSDIRDYQSGSIELLVRYDFRDERSNLENPRYFKKK